MVRFKGLNCECTNKKVIVYRRDGTIGIAGVKNAKDFDFEKLFKCAVQHSGEQILGD